MSYITDYQQKFTDLKFHIENRDQLRRQANGGNSILFSYNPSEEHLYIEKAKELYADKAAFIDISKLLVQFIDKDGWDLFQKYYNNFKNTPHVIFRSDDPSTDLFDLIIGEIEKACQNDWIPFLIRTGCLFGTGIEKVEYLLTNSDQFSGVIQTILKAQKFIKKNFARVKEFKRFVEEVVSELKKADRADTAIKEANDEFARLYKQDMVKNFGSLQQQVQIVKDCYHKLTKNAAAGMSHEYQLLGGKVDAAIRTLKGYPADLNAQNQRKLDELKRYCSDRTIKEPVFKYSISDRNSGYSLSDILNYTALVPTRESELLIIQSFFVTKFPKTSEEDRASFKSTLHFFRAFPICRGFFPKIVKYFWGYMKDAKKSIRKYQDQKR